MLQVFSTVVIIYPNCLRNWMWKQKKTAQKFSKKNILWVTFFCLEQIKNTLEVLLEKTSSLLQSGVQIKLPFELLIFHDISHIIWFSIFLKFSEHVFTGRMAVSGTSEIHGGSICNWISNEGVQSHSPVLYSTIMYNCRRRAFANQQWSTSCTWHFCYRFEISTSVKFWPIGEFKKRESAKIDQN